MEGHKVDSRYRRRCTPSSRGVAPVYGRRLTSSCRVSRSKIRLRPFPRERDPLPRDEGRHEHVRDPVSPRITRNNSSTVAEIDTPMYDLTVGPPSPSLKQELFPKRGWAGLQLVTDKSRPISAVAWSIVVPVLLGKELGFVMRPRGRASVHQRPSSSNTWKGDSR